MDEESVKKRIHALLDEIQTEADPHLLNQYRSIFRKEVPFFRRSYTAAWLLLLAEEGGKGRSGHRQIESRNERTKKKASKASRISKAAPDEETHFISEEESAKLFISIGRNRRVFPREILGLLIAKAQIARDDIGNIRILDNYSFVQIRNTVADTVIEALNGQNFRGRSLTVNYARNRKEDPETEITDTEEA